MNYPNRSRFETAAGPPTLASDEDHKHPSDLKHVASMFSCIERIANGRSNRLDSILGQYCGRGPIADAAPAPNTPTKLSKYLAYAGKNLTIFAATIYEDTFQNNGIWTRCLALDPR